MATDAPEGSAPSWVGFSRARSRSWSPAVANQAPAVVREQPLLPLAQVHRRLEPARVEGRLVEVEQPRGEERVVLEERRDPRARRRARCAAGGRPSPCGRARTPRRGPRRRRGAARRARARRRRARRSRARSSPRAPSRRAGARGGARAPRTGAPARPRAPPTRPRPAAAPTGLSAPRSSPRASPRGTGGTGRRPRRAARGAPAPPRRRTAPPRPPSPRRSPRRAPPSGDVSSRPR